MAKLENGFNEKVKRLEEIKKLIIDGEIDEVDTLIENYAREYLGMMTEEEFEDKNSFEYEKKYNDWD